MPRDKLRAALKLAGRRPVSCVVALTKDRQAVVLLDKRLKPRKLAAKLKSEAKAAGLALDLPTLRFGRASVDGGSDSARVVFRVHKDAPAVMSRAVLPLLRPVGYQRGEFVTDAGLEQEPEEGDDGQDGGDDPDGGGNGADGTGATGATRAGQAPATGAALPTPPSATPGPAAPAAAVAAPEDRAGAAGGAAAAARAPLAGMVPPDLARGVQAAVAADPSRKPALARLLAGVRAGVEGGDPHAAEQGLAALRQAVDGTAPPPAREEQQGRTAQGRAAGAGQAAQAPAFPAEGPRPLQADATLADLARAWDAEQDGTAGQSDPKAPALLALKQGTAPAPLGDGEGLVTPVLSRTPWAPPQARPAPPAEPLPAPKPLPGPAGPPSGVRPPGMVPPVETPPLPGPLARALPAMRVIGGIAVVVAGGALANQMNGANFDNQVVDALRRFGLDPSKPADVKAAQAYVFMRVLAPVWQQFYSVPSQDPGNGRVAEAVLRAVQADPDLLDRALEHDQGAAEKLEGVIQGALGGAGGAAPAPGQAAPSGQDRPGTPGLPQEPAPGQGVQPPAWLKEVEGIETFDADEREFIEHQAQGGMKHADIVRALEERRRGGGGGVRGQGGAGGSGPVVPGQPPAAQPPTRPGAAQPTPRDGVIGGKPVGEPEPIKPRMHRDMQDGLRLQAASEDAMAAAGYRVERSPVVRLDERLTQEEEGKLRPRELDPQGRIRSTKNPDARIGGNLADMVAPMTPKLEGVRDALSDKIKDRQAYRLVLNLGRTSVTREQVEALLRRKPIEGLQELFIIEKNGAIFRIFPDPEQITPAPQAR